MFGNMLYFDAPRISEYRAIVKGEKNIKIGKIDVSSGKDASIKLPIAGGDIKTSRSYEATIEESALFDCDEFEKLLIGRDDYFDFTKEDHDLSTLGRGYIIKFESVIRVPEAFDMTQTISQFKPYIETSIVRDIGTDEKAAFKLFFETKNPKIPIICECSDHILCAKMDSKFLRVEYPQLEEFESSEVTILARMISSNEVSKQKAIFDPLKDFISLNRAIRRSITNDRPDGLKELFLDEEYRNIEVLAIYQ